MSIKDVPSTPFSIWKIPTNLSDAEKLALKSGTLPAGAVEVPVDPFTAGQYGTAVAVRDSLSSSDPVEAAIKARQAPLSTGKLISETGELIFDVMSPHRRYMVDTAYAAAVAGTLNNTTLTFPNAQASLRSDIAQGTISAVGLDDKPLNQSRRILLIHHADAKATGVTISTS